MTTPVDAIDVLVRAIDEVAADANVQRKLARAATSRAHCEMEWVYELFGTKELEKVVVARESPLGQRARADMLISGTPIEFKSAQAHFAIPGAFDGTAAKRDRADDWLGKDLRRSAESAGIFVLIVSTVTPPARSPFAAMPLGEAREIALDRYDSWLSAAAHGWPAPHAVTRVPGGHGAYAGREATHDLLVARWAGR